MHLTAVAYNGPACISAVTVTMCYTYNYTNILLSVFSISTHKYTTCIKLISLKIVYRIAGKFDGQNIWRFAPPEVLGGFKFGDG